MSEHTGKVTIELPPREEQFILEFVAKYLYRELKNAPDFPYDESRKTRDPRKIYTRTTGKWHLKAHGAAYVGERKIIGPFYKGAKPSGARNEIIFVWSMKKAYGEGYSLIFDYAEINLEEFFEVYPTRHDIETAIDLAVDDWWNRNYK
jgi:hypothetical protein